MTDLNLSEGQEFYIGGQRYVVKGGAPVQEAKRGPLGGELVRYDSLSVGDTFFVEFSKTDDYYANSLSRNHYFTLGDLVEIKVPQQAEGRVDNEQDKEALESVFSFLLDDIHEFSNSVFVVKKIDNKYEFIIEYDSKSERNRVRKSYKLSKPQDKGRVMTAGEAAKLPDIVGKRVMVEGGVFDTDDEGDPLAVCFSDGLNTWIAADDKIEVLD